MNPSNVWQNACDFLNYGPLPNMTPAYINEKRPILEQIDMQRHISEVCVCSVLFHQNNNKLFIMHVTLFRYTYLYIRTSFLDPIRYSCSERYTKKSIVKCNVFSDIKTKISCRLKLFLLCFCWKFVWKTFKNIIESLVFLTLHFYWGISLNLPHFTYKYEMGVQVFEITKLYTFNV